MLGHLLGLFEYGGTCPPLKLEIASSLAPLRLGLSDLWAGFNAFICKPAIWNTAPQGCLSPQPLTTCYCDVLNASDIYPAWEAGNERDVIRASISSNVYKCNSWSFSWFQLDILLSVLEELWMLGLLPKLEINNKTPHLCPTLPQTSKDRQRSANVMEDINNFHVPPPELAVGSEFKWPSSSHFERHAPIISL